MEAVLHLLTPFAQPERFALQESEPPNEFECEDLTLHAHLMELVGCGLSKQEMYGTMLAMKKLGETVEYNLATCRFFGKVPCCRRHPSPAPQRAMNSPSRMWVPWRHARRSWGPTRITTCLSRHRRRSGSRAR